MADLERHINRRPVSTMLTEQEWGALDRWRENHNHRSISAALHALVVSATSEHDSDLQWASQMGDAGPITGAGRNQP